jgi:hypothetical protein
MKIVLPMRHGLGDQIFTWFVHRDNNILLSKLYKAYQQGLVTEIVGVYEKFMNPSIKDIFENLSLKIKCIPSGDFPNVELMDCDNFIPKEVNGYLNLLSNCPEEISKIEISEEDRILIPTQKTNIPSSDYIVMMSMAGEKPRFLHDENIIGSIKNITHIPIISIGKQLPRNGNLESSLVGDINLVNKLNILEVNYLIEHCKFVVSSCSYLRNYSTLFGKPIIELLESKSCLKTDIERTTYEYEQHAYGMNALNSWFLFPDETIDFENKLKEILNA